MVAATLPIFVTIQIAMQELTRSKYLNHIFFGKGIIVKRVQSPGKSQWSQSILCKRNSGLHGNVLLDGVRNGF